MSDMYIDCERKGLLRRIPASKEQANESIHTAKLWIEEAEKNIQGGAYRSSVISSYMSMFHAARAILFCDGYREKSHFCIARFLEEKYAKVKLLEQTWIDLLDYYRELRHNDQYSLNFLVTKEEAKGALDNAAKFIERMGALLECITAKK